LHQWLFGYELPDTIVVITEDANVLVCATKKKCEFLRPALGKSDKFKMKLLLRNKADGNAENYETLIQAAQEAGDADNRKIGVILKERKYNYDNGSILSPYEKLLDESEIDLVDIAPALSLVLGPKDESEWDLMKKSSVLCNKVMKHGFVKRLEEIIEDEKKITHEAFANEIENILEDPNKIKLNVPPSDVQSCYFPIVQSGGSYDIRVSAQSSTEELKHDIITVSLGSRYKLYCSNIARTFLVDPPKKVSSTYEVLLEMQEACLKAMQPGNQLKSVYKAAVEYLRENDHEDLVSKLPKNLGFAQGIDFRDSTLTLSAKNNVPFRAGMVFCLAVGFQDLELMEKDLDATPSASSVSQKTTYTRGAIG
jgi:nucleosome binding factor SPN SPT16 subunit